MTAPDSVGSAHERVTVGSLLPGLSKLVSGYKFVTLTYYPEQPILKKNQQSLLLISTISNEEIVRFVYDDVDGPQRTTKAIN